MTSQLTGKEQIIESLEKMLDNDQIMFANFKTQINLLEKKASLLEDNIKRKDEQIKKLVGIIEDYKFLLRAITGLEDDDDE